MHSLCEIRQIMVDLRTFEERLREQTSLSLNEALCLCQVGNGMLEPGALARDLELSPSRLSRIFDSLERQRLIQRTLSTTDRRGVKIHLTKQGEAMVEQLHSIQIELPDHLKTTLDILQAAEQEGE
jgi:DNA-binding MarR family transcriptional regulator